MDFPTQCLLQFQQYLKEKNICSITQFEKQNNKKSTNIVQHLLVGETSTPLEIFPNFRGEHKTCVFKPPPSLQTKTSPPKKTYLFHSPSSMEEAAPQLSPPKRSSTLGLPYQSPGASNAHHGVKIILSNWRKTGGVGGVDKFLCTGWLEGCLDSRW